MNDVETGMTYIMHSTEFTASHPKYLSAGRGWIAAEGEAK
jgi:hypothetical protein